jgi:hypothetical protein
MQKGASYCFFRSGRLAQTRRHATQLRKNSPLLFRSGEFYFAAISLFEAGVSRSGRTA